MNNLMNHQHRDLAFVALVTSKAVQFGESVDMITPQPKMNVKMNKKRHLPVPVWFEITACHGGFY